MLLKGFAFVFVLAELAVQKTHCNLDPIARVKRVYASSRPDYSYGGGSDNEISEDASSRPEYSYGGGSNNEISDGNHGNYYEMENSYPDAVNGHEIEDHDYEETGYGGFDYVEENSQSGNSNEGANFHGDGSSLGGRNTHPRVGSSHGEANTHQSFRGGGSNHGGNPHGSRSPPHTEINLHGGNHLGNNRGGGGDHNAAGSPYGGNHLGESSYGEGNNRGGDRATAGSPYGGNHLGESSYDEGNNPGGDHNTAGSPHGGRSSFGGNAFQSGGSHSAGSPHGGESSYGGNALQSGGSHSAGSPHGGESSYGGNAHRPRPQGEGGFHSSHLGSHLGGRKAYGGSHGGNMLHSQYDAGKSGWYGIKGTSHRKSVQNHAAPVGSYSGIPIGHGGGINLQKLGPSHSGHGHGYSNHGTSKKSQTAINAAAILAIQQIKAVDRAASYNFSGGGGGSGNSVYGRK